MSEHDPTAVATVRPGPGGTPRSHLVALAVLLPALIAGCGSGSASKAPSAATATATATAVAAPPGTFVSDQFPYQIKIPKSWTIDPLSQGPGSDADEWSSPHETQRLLVGHGYPGPGETLANRVESNRSDETAEGCTSNPKQDRPIDVGGEDGVLWSYSCAPVKPGFIAARDAFFLSAQTIHRRPGHRPVGYRFTVVVPLAKKRQAKALLDRFLSGLSFPEDSRATDD